MSIEMPSLAPRQERKKPAEAMTAEEVHAKVVESFQTVRLLKLFELDQKFEDDLMKLGEDVQRLLAAHKADPKDSAVLVNLYTVQERIEDLMGLQAELREALRKRQEYINPDQLGLDTSEDAKKKN